MTDQPTPQNGIEFDGITVTSSTESLQTVEQTLNRLLKIRNQNKKLKGYIS